MSADGDFSVSGPRFRFGIHLTQCATAAEWLATAREAESVGFDIITMPDHFTADIPQFAPVPALAMIAGATTSVRLGTWVFCNDYRHPVRLAHDSATLDVLSGGRLELGLGAGWKRQEYEAAGIAWDTPGTRISRLEESIRVLKAVWAGQSVASFTGKHYQLRDLSSWPKPIQTPHPPLAIGGGGTGILSLAAREADIVGINFDLSSSRASAEGRLKEKVEVVRAAAGERFAGLELQMRVLYASTSEGDHAGRLRELAGRLKVTSDDVRRSPHVMIGSQATICEELEQRRDEFGISYVTFSQEDLDTVAPIVGALKGT